jgi:hypothetical protein
LLIDTATTLVCPFPLLNVLNESHLACVEIRPAEIEEAAGQDADQIHLGDLTEVTVKAMRKRPEHVADILLVSSWMFAEACSAPTRNVTSSGSTMAIAQGTEDALS